MGCVALGALTSAAAATRTLAQGGDCPGASRFLMRPTDTIAQFLAVPLARGIDMAQLTSVICGYCGEHMN